MPTTVAIPVQEHGQIVIDICLCKIVRELLEIQYRLRNLKAIRIDRTVRILSQAEFFWKPTPSRENSQVYLYHPEARRRKTKLESDIRSSNLGTASIALSKYVLDMVCCAVQGKIPSYARLSTNGWKLVPHGFSFFTPVKISYNSYE